MDDGYEGTPQKPGQPSPHGARRPDPKSTPRRPGDGAEGGGLLRRYGGRDERPASDAPPPQPSSASPPRGNDQVYSTPLQDRLARMQDRQEGPRGAWDAFTGQIRRLGDNIRQAATGDRVPRAGEWRASDFAPEELEDWDRQGAVPFELPPDPDASEHMPRAPRRSADLRRGRGWDDGMGDDSAWDADWETGSWDNSWATGYGPGMTGNAGDEGYRYSASYPAFGESGPVSEALGTLGYLASPQTGVRRRDRIRYLVKRRPAAAAMLAFFVLGFLLTSFAPLIPLLRLGYDVADAARRVSALQSLMAGGSSSLLNATVLADAQAEVNGLERDLYEINGAVNLIGAPLSGISPTIRNYRLLANMGVELTGAANLGLEVAQTIMTPLQGGALSSTSKGITAADLQRARSLLADAEVRIVRALDIYKQIDPKALPAQLQPGSKYGGLLAQMPLALGAIAEIKTLMDAVPSLLGVGQPAHFLVIAMDESELRPAGGFMGNYGILTLENGKQSQTQPLALRNTYDLDGKYYKLPQFANSTTGGCPYPGPQPPDYFWWWPYRCLKDFGWGLRDSGLSPDFPTNARTAMQIVQDAGEVPNNSNLQGVLAFTPQLIARLMTITGPITLPEYKVTVTPQNLEVTIHEFQLGSRAVPGVDRKAFTHKLASVLLEKLKTMHGSALKQVFKVAQEAIKAKDLQIYFSDPRAELVLQQLGLASEVSTSGSDGFMVVDANDGGNKANQFVTEHQTDVVTLLPNGGALHRLRIDITYDKKGSVYEGTTMFESYSDVQRVYLPGDASLLGYAGYNPARSVYPAVCGSEAYATFITACGPANGLYGTTTNSDVPGRTMVLGNVFIRCGPSADMASYDLATEMSVCTNNPVKRTQTIYLSWYTPNAFTRDAAGHGTYSMLVEKQPGSQTTLTVYVSTSQLGAALPDPTGRTPDLTVSGQTPAARDAAFQQLLAGAKKVFDGPLDQNQIVTAGF